MKTFYVISLAFLGLALIGKCESNTSKRKDVDAQGIVPEKFEFVREEPGNEVGVYTKVIAQVHRKVNGTIDEMMLNRKYLPDDVYESLLERCKTSQEGSAYVWHDCVADAEGLFAKVKGGVPEEKNKTITYLEVDFKAYKKIDEEGNENICMLEETYKPKAFIVLKTFSHRPSNDSFPRDFVESVATVHQHQLDEFGEHFLSIFGDKIDEDLIFNFGQDEYYDRDPPYECFLSIAGSESASVIKDKCDFFCVKKVGVPDDMMEEILAKAREEADEQESHDEL